MRVLSLMNNMVIPAEWKLLRWPKNTFQKSAQLRGVHLGLACGSFLAATFDTLAGVSLSLNPLVTIGRFPHAVVQADTCLSSSNHILARPFMHLLKTVNPEAQFTEADKPLPGRSVFKQPRISSEGDGFITEPMMTGLRVRARQFYQSNQWLQQHLASRCTYAALGVACVATRGMDACLSVPATAAAFVSGGRYESVNNLAFRALQAPALVKDLFYCARKVINPWSGVIQYVGPLY